MRSHWHPGLVPTNRAEGGVERGVVEAQVEDAANEGGSGAGHSMATAPVGQLLATNPVLLGVESEARVGGAGDGVHWGSQEAKGRLTDLERDILEGQRPVGAGGTVFPRAKKEKETYPGQVDSGAGIFVWSVRDEGLGVMEDLDR